MKIASNKLSDLYEFYKSELLSMYDADELYAIFEIVCEKYLRFSRAELKQQFDSNINQSDLIFIYDAAKALKTGLPVQYILKEAFFYDSFFEVTPDVLIPRPETEELVDLVIKSISPGSLLTNHYSLLDIGTGSGCIPITLKKQLPGIQAFGIDISEAALEVAKRNARKQLYKKNLVPFFFFFSFIFPPPHHTPKNPHARKHQTEIHFQKIDVLAPNASFQILNLTQLVPEPVEGHYSLIISNPPYIAHSEAAQMEQRVLAHEPHLALFVDNDDPIIFYRRIIDLCESCLAPGGHLFFELNPLFAVDIKNYADSVNFFNFAELMIDMSGKNRFLKAQKK
jgi:release factor glutamine methyltransferase